MYINEYYYELLSIIHSFLQYKNYKSSIVLKNFTIYISNNRVKNILNNTIQTIDTKQNDLNIEKSLKDLQNAIKIYLDKKYY